MRVAVTFHDLRTPYIFPKAGPLRWRANLALAQHSELPSSSPTPRMPPACAQVQPVAGKLHEVPIGANIQPDPPAGFRRADSAPAGAWGRTTCCCAILASSTRAKAARS